MGNILMTDTGFEMLLAEVIDQLYIKYKEDFCDYENRTHKLGWFKEEIKAEMARRLEALKGASNSATLEDN